MILPLLAAAGVMTALAPSSPDMYSMAIQRFGNNPNNEIVVGPNGLYQLRNKKTGILLSTWTGTRWLSYYGVLPIYRHVGSEIAAGTPWDAYGKKILRIKAGMK